jgi:hypothetical protein
MARAIRRLVEFVSGIATLWGFLPAAWQASVIATLTVMTAYLGYSTLGLFWATVGATAVFAFTTSGLYYALLLWNRELYLKELLSKPLKY